MRPLAIALGLSLAACGAARAPSDEDVEDTQDRGKVEKQAPTPFVCPDTTNDTFGGEGPFDAELVGGGLDAFEGARAVLAIGHLNEGEPLQLVVVCGSAMLQT